MARTKKTDKTDETEESTEVKISSKAFLGSYLNSKENKEFHFNNEASVNFVVTTGSMILDKEFDGGYRPGLQRMCGASGGGKTSHTMDVCANFLETVPRSKGFYIKAEGRLSQNIIDRRGLKVVYNYEEWEYGTIFVFETNVYEVALDAVRGLIKVNRQMKPEDREHYFFVFDSMDGLISKGDLDKQSSESNKVAAGAALQSDFLKRISLAMNKFGHMCFMMSQVRAKVSLDPYAKKDPNDMTSSSGGNAPVHYPDYILDFKRQMKTNKILPDAKGQITQDNAAVGHYVELTIAKSDNENQLMTIKYPVKYGRVGRSAVWIEREIVEMMLMWNKIEKAGSWFAFCEDAIEYCKEKGSIELASKMQGLGAIYDYLEENQDVCAVLRKYVEEKIMNVLPQ